MDAAVFAFGERLLAEFEEIGLPKKSLPTVAQNPWRVDATGGKVRGCAAGRPIGDRETGAVCIVAIDGARHAEISRDGAIFFCSGKVLTDNGIAATRNASDGACRRSIDWAARVINHVGSRVLVTGRVSFHYVPVE